VPEEGHTPVLISARAAFLEPSDIDVAGVRGWVRSRLARERFFQDEFAAPAL